MVGTRLNNRWFWTYYSYYFAWLQFLYILETLAQKDELERLIRWAYRKKLKGVREHYQRLLSETELRLLDRAFRFPQVSRAANIAYYVKVVLSPTPRFYVKGAAAKSRLRN